MLPAGQGETVDASELAAGQASGEPPGTDQIEFITAGAVDTPPIPWQDRPTFQQAVEIR